MATGGEVIELIGVEAEGAVGGEVERDDADRRDPIDPGRRK